MRPIHGVPDVQPSDVCTRLKHEFNDADTASEDSHAEVLCLRPDTIPQQDFDEAVKVAVDGDAQRGAQRILVVNVRRPARLEPCFYLEQPPLPAKPTEFE